VTWTDHRHPAADRNDMTLGERAMTEPDQDREVPMIDDTDIVVLPDQTLDDTDADWSESIEDSEVRLLEDRPPHW
jgi:hypothetical protein